MPLFLVALAFAAFLQWRNPRVASGCASVLTFGFLVPLMLIGGGVFLKFGLMVFASGASSSFPFWLCCIIGGGPLALFILKVVEAD
jgi:hypothetical protein